MLCNICSTKNSNNIIYGRSGANMCSKCPPLIIQLFYIVGLGFGIALFTFYMLRYGLLFLLFFQFSVEQPSKEQATDSAYQNSGKLLLVPYDRLRFQSQLAKQCLKGTLCVLIPSQIIRLLGVFRLSFLDSRILQWLEQQLVLNLLSEADCLWHCSYCAQSSLSWSTWNQMVSQK